MSNCNDIDTILRRNGTGQIERFIKQLDPATFELNDFDIEDWIIFTYSFAKHVNYFHTSDSTTAQGDWQDFFNCFDFGDSEIPFRTSRTYKNYKENITQTLNTFKEDGRLTPHLTLFVCFLQLLELSKKRFNALTKRHLDFYYKNILQVDKRQPIPDKVHVLFELAKKAVEEQIVKDTVLNAKQDPAGNPLTYKTNEELIANQAKVAALKTVYNDVNAQELKSSTVANTLDGFEEPLSEEEPYWLPFGYPSSESNYITLPDAEIGFALASPMLALQEGKRTIEIQFTFDNNDSNTALNDFKSDAPITTIAQTLSIYGSGTEKWIDLFNPKNDEDILTVSIPDKNTLVLVFELGKDVPAIVNYNPEFLLEKYDTTFPVVRFLIDTAKDGEDNIGHDFYRAIVNRTLTEIKIKVDVEEASLVILENDNGVLKSKKPFFPFTPQPIKSSNFYINYPEAFAKAWTSFDVNFSWKNTPLDFRTWYEAYLKPEHSRGTADDYIKAAQDIIDEEVIVKGDNYFTVAKSILHKEEWQEIPNTDNAEDFKNLFYEVLAEDEKTKIGHQYIASIKNSEGSTYITGKTGPVRLSLEQSFLHELFPRLYALALTDQAKTTPIPNEAYTPLAENITINYTAEESRVLKSQTITKETVILPENTEERYLADRIKLFHIHPFGQCEEHNHLKTKKHLRGIVDGYDGTIVSSAVVPKYCEGGELFIGLENARVQQNIALLVQVLEGSENTETPTFSDQERIQWAVLCEDQWKSVQNEIIANSTDNFLTSGIVKFNIPREATTVNTRLPEGYIWVRAKMHRAYNAVCKVINIHTQAVQATLQNNNNVLDHLDKGLPSDTIKKLITRIPQVKGVAQPYNSFDGIPKESDLIFYRRISERLRHKNRAITLWDYEHLILQEFPEVYKAKCLNHTHIEVQNELTKDHYQAAGYVTLVVIPDSINKNVFDIYQPRVSTSLINKIKRFINQYNTMHVATDVINPQYEEVKITLEVQFYEGYDERFYIQKMEEDITKFLSPWAFDPDTTVVFGVDFHKSMIIDYLEKLPYVDYLQNIVVEKNDSIVPENRIAPTTPKSILVSAKTHNISTVLTNCKGIKEQETLICQ